MSARMTGELMWVQKGEKVSLGVYVRPKDQVGLRPSVSVRLSNLLVPIWTELPRQKILYRHPIKITKDGNKVTAGPVFAILAASGPSSFVGSRANFRDIMTTARRRNAFMYVLAVDRVNYQSFWSGYVRLGYQRWMRIPCPQPEAVYNRIPNRNLERTETALAAKDVLRSLHIPMFNPDYFNKAEIYQVIQAAKLGQFLPDTAYHCTAQRLRAMLMRHKAVYLKPAGGSVGHGMIRITRAENAYEVAVLKNSRCQALSASGFPRLWGVVQQQRLPGHYVIQAAVPRIEWQGRPCDFRVLVQKRRGSWHVVGTGVRVSGTNTITTHVPNGGYIASAKQVLTETFAEEANEVEWALEDMSISCAEAIDAHYRAELGEMSMDIGVDESGQLWFFEANAKPMKFDERDIRQRSLAGIVSHLEELHKGRKISKT